MMPKRIGAHAVEDLKKRLRDREAVKRRNHSKSLARRAERDNK